MDSDVSSGAVPRWAGCSSAGTIAINTGSEAPMVTKAYYAVISDVHEVIPPCWTPRD